MNINEAKNLIKEYAYKNYKKMLREPAGKLSHPYIVPGASYSDSLWDWDSWLTNIAIRQIFVNKNEESEFCQYEKGCVINFLEHTRESGCTPHLLTPTRDTVEETPEYSSNTHKPCLAQHVAFILKNTADKDWFRPYIEKLDKFLKGYMKHQRHENGIYFWLDDAGIGVDNDPCTFYRPPKSSGSIYLNCLMYKELSAMVYISDLFSENELKAFYEKETKSLYDAIQKHSWDEKDGFFYSVDLNLYPIDLNNPIHQGCPRHWDSLIQRIGVWSGFLAMWAEIATKEQAERMVKENYLDSRTFYAPFGVRTLSKMEKMYVIKASGNPSCWLGPIWGISNYMTFSALVKYGYEKEAKELAEKTVLMFGNDIKETGELHEYYHPETGAPIMNPGFQNWNLLSLNMIAYLDGENRTEEF